MYFIGYDIGSSSIKASLLDGENNQVIASASYPQTEMKIDAIKVGWAEQNPDEWWRNLVHVTKRLLAKTDINKLDIRAIGVAYQMHGLVLIDKDKKVLRPAIIWCDSRAVHYGEKAFQEIGEEKCLSNLLNSPGNFTASKLKWVKENEPEIYKKAYKFMLPGDYIAMKLTGNIQTTQSGLSEGILWNFRENKIAEFLMDYYGLDKEMVPDVVPTFSSQGKITKEAAKELQLHTNIEVSYRAGDQPNNAFSLNILEPGEIAATGGTSGVMFGVSNQAKYDPLSRVNTFLHVNHSATNPRYGVLLCVNGVGIQYAWLKKLVRAKTYDTMNEIASKVQVGSEGLLVYPFGNGAERILENKDIGASISNLNFNIHDKKHLIRAVLEGIVFSFYFGLKIMRKTGVEVNTIKAGHTNLFLSDVFTNALSSISNSVIELYSTDGSQGAARGAGVGINYYKNFSEAFTGLKLVEKIYPDEGLSQKYNNIYENWTKKLNLLTTKNK